jgi:hypothetical protein
MIEKFMNNKFAKQVEGSGRGLIVVLSSHLPGGRLMETTINRRIANVPAD